MRLVTAVFFAICAMASLDGFAQLRVPVDDPRFYQAFYVANACEAAYLPKKDVQGMLDRMGVLKHRFLDIKVGTSDTQVLIATLENYSLVCFRGSQEAMDWVTNVQAWPTPYPLGPFGTEVHTGFYNAWLEAKKMLMPALREVGVTKMRPNAQPDDSEPLKECHPVLIGGHSLGGALATLAGIELVMEHYPVLGIYTFGQPRVLKGEKIKKDVADAAQFLYIERFAFKTDKVPFVPSSYLHVGFDRYSDAIAALLSKDKKADISWFVGSHAMSNYVRSMAALAAEHTQSPQTRALLEWFRNRDRKLTEYLKLGTDQAAKFVVSLSTAGGGKDVVDISKIRCTTP